MNFLDVTLDLDTGSHKPFHKPNEDLKYVNKDSNHPPVVINTLDPDHTVLTVSRYRPMACPVFS